MSLIKDDRLGRKSENAGKRKYGCGAFHRMYAVDIDERLYPCHRFVGLPEFCVGNIYEKQETETEQWCNVDDRDKCYVCRFLSSHGFAL